MTSFHLVLSLVSLFLWSYGRINAFSTPNRYTLPRSSRTNCQSARFYSIPTPQARNDKSQQEDPFVIHIDGQEGLDEEIVSKQRDCILFLSAKFCKKCQAMSPGFSRMARIDAADTEILQGGEEEETSAANVIYAKVDTVRPSGKELAVLLGAAAVPAFVLFRGGQQYGSPLKTPNKLAIEYLKTGKKWDPVIFKGNNNAKKKKEGGSPNSTRNANATDARIEAEEAARLKEETEREKRQLAEIQAVPDDDEMCSIDNLDACLEKGFESEECMFDNPDACVEKVKNNDQSFDQSLSQFMSKPIIEVQLALLVLLSSFLVGLGTLDSIPPIAASVLYYGELTISAVFTIEYLARWKLENFSIKYVVQPLAIIDFLALLPGLIKFAAILEVVTPSGITGALINLRLLRILRLQRVLTDYDTFTKFEMALGLNPSDTRPYQLQLARVVISIFTLLSVTSGLIYSAEHVVNPDITDYFTALYFTLTTLTTVGFGDIHPVTTAGRWIVSGSILVGSAVIPAQAAALVEALLSREGEQDPKKPMEENDGAAVNVGSNNYALLEASVNTRMDRIEKKVDETNERIDRVLAVLENTLSKEAASTRPASAGGEPTNQPKMKPPFDTDSGESEPSTKG